MQRTVSLSLQNPEFADEIWLLAHPSIFYLAKSIANSIPKVVFKDIIRWNKFENFYPNLFIKNVRDLIGREVIFLANLIDPATMFEQLSVINALPKYLVGSMTILLPFFPCGTMEKIDQEGQIATAKTVATLLSTVPMTKFGPVQIVIYDIHALQVRFYFGESIIPRIESCIPLLEPEIDKIKARDQNVCIVFPDDGARKRFQTYFTDDDSSQGDRDHHPKRVDKVLYCSKKRLENKRFIEIMGSIPKQGHIIIIDDLVNTGSTVLECARECFAAGASHVSVYVVHGIFPNKAWKNFLNPVIEGNQNSYLENFWVTDSIPHDHEMFEDPKNIFKLFSITDRFAQLFK